MNLSDLSLTHIIKEDSFQSVSAGVLKESGTPIIWIKIPSNYISTASKHLVAEHLYNIIDIFEFEHHVHIILKDVDGMEIMQYLSVNRLAYDQRIHLCYELLKALTKYDAFHYTYQLQLMTDDQILIQNDIVMFREIINYTAANQHTFNDVVTRIGYLFSDIMKSKLDTHVQFVDNLIIAHHDYENLEDLLNDYKDIFIYEKKSVIDAMPREYNIILTDEGQIQVSEVPYTPPARVQLDASSQYKLPPAMPVEAGKVENNNNDDKINEPHQVISNKVQATSDLTPPIAEDSLDKSSQPQIESIEDSFESGVEPDLETQSIGYLEKEEKELQPPLEERDSKTGEDNLTVEDEPEKEPILESPELSTDVIDSEALQDELLNYLFGEVPADTNAPNTIKITAQDTMTKRIKIDELIEENQPDKKINFKQFAFPVFTTLALVLIIVLCMKLFFFKGDVLEASYKIKEVSDHQVAFINTSKSSDEIISCEWEVYYDNELVETFITQNLYPVFSTEGTYTITLKICDEEGNWSEVYSEDYVYASDSATSSN